MARFRDVKQGRGNKTKEIKKPKRINTSLCSGSLMDRFKAFLTDTFMLTMPLMYIVFYFVMGSREEFSQHKAMGWIYIVLPHMLLILSLWFFKQQTPGLKAYELLIVDSTTGEKPTLISLINRYFQTAIASFLIPAWFIPYLRKDRKTLQDIMSGTCIKNTPNEKSPDIKE